MLNYQSIRNGPEEIHAKLAYRDRMAPRLETRLQYKCFNIFKDNVFIKKKSCQRIEKAA